MKYILILLIFLLSIESTSAQEIDSMPCPLLKLLGPHSGEIPQGQNLEISVERFKKNYEKSHSITFMWVTNNGNIIGDNKKRTVLISTKGLLNQDINATVIVLGLGNNCPSKQSINIHVVAPKVGTFSKIIKGRKK